MRDKKLVYVVLVAARFKLTLTPSQADSKENKKAFRGALAPGNGTSVTFFVCCSFTELSVTIKGHFRRLFITVAT